MPNKIYSSLSNYCNPVSNNFNQLTSLVNNLTNTIKFKGVLTDKSDLDLINNNKDKLSIGDCYYYKDEYGTSRTLIYDGKDILELAGAPSVQVNNYNNNSLYSFYSSLFQSYQISEEVRLESIFRLKEEKKEIMKQIVNEMNSSRNNEGDRKISKVSNSSYFEKLEKIEDELKFLGEVE